MAKVTISGTGDLCPSRTAGASGRARGKALSVHLLSDPAETHIACASHMVRTDSALCNCPATPSVAEVPVREVT
jgi:hypothetical protein